MNVYIEYGWPEGKWHGRLLRKALVDAGYGMTSSPELADIVIAHSVGCYMLPSNNKAKVILLIGLPNRSDKPLYACTIQKVMLEAKNRYWLTKTFFHVVYAFRLPNIFRAWKALRRRQVNVGRSAKVILVRNERDTYIDAEVSQELAIDGKWAYVELPGQHDDIWTNPQPYIAMIKV